MPYLLHDADDTVLAAGDVLEKFCSERLGKPALYRLRDTHYVDHAFDVTQEVAEELCHEFWHSSLMDNLGPERDALEVLPRLYAQGYRFVAIAAENGVMERRKRNLENVFGFEWEAVHCTHGSTKAEFLSKYEPSIWVEDHWHNCQAGGKMGHLSFLLNLGYNLVDHEPPLFTRVDSWKEIERHMLIRLSPTIKI